MFKVYYKMPLCYLSLHSDGKFLTRVDFCDNKRSEKNCSLLDLAKYELDLYFTHKLRKFSIPVLIQGTDFESKVYKALMEIPYGKIATYKDIAEKLIIQKLLELLEMQILKIKFLFLYLVIELLQTMA